MMLTIKQGDRPLIESLLSNLDGNVVNLTSATVRLKAVNVDTEVTEIDVAASVMSPATSGIVRYQSQVGEFDEVGLYKMEWEVTFPSGPVLTYPSEDFDYVKVTPGL